MSLEMWLVVLYHYEMWCYDIGCIAVDEHCNALNNYWESF